MAMRLSELMALTQDTICLYEEIGEAEYKDLYKGRKQDIPSDLLNRDVMVFMAKKEGILDIELSADHKVQKL